MSDPRLPARLARAQAAQRDQAARRATEATCPHDQGSAEYVHIARNGARHFYRGCIACQAHLDGGRWLPGPAPADTPVGRDDRLERPPCVRCGQFGTEYHHFAPRALFGPEEAELWPAIWLCPDCHAYWHMVMAEGCM